MLVLALLACQEPFDADRHDLRGDRIAALSVHVADGVVRPRAALWVGGRGWSDAPVDLAWGCVADTDAVAALDPADAIATGPAPDVACDAILALVATFPSGALERAFVAVPADAAAGVVGELSREILDLRIAGLAGPELLPDARGALEGTPGADVPPGGFARFAADVPDGATARFMATSGTFFELDASTADWAAGDLILDDDELDAAVADPPGVSTLLVLAVTPSGANPFRAAEVWVGPADPGVWLGDRWVPADEPFAGTASVTLLADDASPCGLRLAPPVGSADPPACLAGAFHPDLLLDGTCLRSELVGATVLVDAAVAP